MYEEDNPPDIDFSIVSSIIQKHLPSVKKNEIQFLYHGTNNVYDVKNRYIFRFPSTVLPSEERSSLIQREARLLKTLQPHISLRIPNPEYVDANHEHPHMGYRKLLGASLYRFYDDAPIEKKSSIGEALGRFLGELHTLDLNELWDDSPEPAFDPRANRDYYRSIFRRIQKEIYPNLSEPQKEWTGKLFHDFLDNDEIFDYNPGLTHGDFDTTNILTNPETLEILGIIDFEETRMYDPTADFLFQDEGPECMKAMLKAYPRMIDSHFSHRMTFRLGRQPFIYILSGINLGLERMTAYGYQALDEMMDAWNRYSSVLNESFAALKL